MANAIIKFDDLKNLCRICLEKRENMISIFQKQIGLNLLKPYNEMFEECTSVHVSEDDVFPKNLCTECSKNLEQSYNLKIQCIMSEKLLRTSIENLQIKIETANSDIQDWTNNFKNEIFVKEEHMNECMENRNAEVKHEDNLVQYGIKSENENLEESNEINLPLEHKDDENSTENTNEMRNTTYWHRATLMDHESVLTENEEFKCEICNEKFKTKNLLCKHSSCHEFTRPFLCNYCGKTFRDRANFKSHIRIHTNDLRHSCNLCEKKFRTSTSLKFHLNSHSNERKFSCKICNASYTQQNSLRSHMDNHTDEQFACEICGKCFATKTYRAKHRKIHTDVRKHICTHCNKPFLKSDSLKRHLRVHTGEKPFECTICGKKFAQKHVLKSHLKIHDKS